MNEQEKTAEMDENTVDTLKQGHSEAVAQSRQRGERAEEIGGPQGLEPTRYGDWERKGRCVDF